MAEAGLRSLRDDGQLLVIGFTSGEIPRLPANQILLRNRRVTGVDWGGWTVTHAAENQQLLADVIAAVAREELHPVEPRTYPLTDVAEALTDQLGRRVVGKTILVP
jgi:NADPH2:quinone reductase